MLFDGIHVLVRKKYFGPEVPGPWRLLPLALGVDPMKLGPLFAGVGVLWLSGAVALWLYPEQASYLIATAAILSLWYIKFGTLLSLIALAILGANALG